MTERLVPWRTLKSGDRFRMAWGYHLEATFLKWCYHRHDGLSLGYVRLFDGREIFISYADHRSVWLQEEG